MAKTLLYEMVPAEAASRFGGLPVLVRDILKLCDGTRTLDAICKRSPLSDDRTSQVVERLLELGLVQRRPAAPTKRARRRNITPQGTAWIAGEQPLAAPIAIEAPAPLAIEKPAEPIASEPIAAEPIAIEKPDTAIASPSEIANDGKSEFNAIAKPLAIENAIEAPIENFAAPEPSEAAVAIAAEISAAPVEQSPAIEKVGTEPAAPSTNLTIRAGAEGRPMDVAIALSDTLVMNAPRFEESAFSPEEESFFNSSIDHLVQDEFAD